MITYAQKMGFTFALGDPIAPAETMGELLDEFTEAFGDPIFVASQRHTAEWLAKSGYRINQFGYDTVVDLPNHSFQGNAYKRIRYGSNWLKTKGGQIAEAPDCPVSDQVVRAMSGEWRKTRVTPREVLFLNRRFSVQPEHDVRRFYALSSEGAPIGFQLVGAHRAEATLLALGTAFQKATDWHNMHPAL